MSRRSRNPAGQCQITTSGSSNTIYPPAIDVFDGYCCRFAGGFVTDEYMAVDTAPNLQFEYDDPFSVSLWINLSYSDQASTSTFYISNHSSVGWYLYRDSGAPTGKLRFYIYDGTSAITLDYSLVNPSRFNRRMRDGLWHHIVITYAGDLTGSNAKMYVDGKLRKIGSGTLTGGSTIIANKFRIGWDDNAAPATKFEGLMGPVGVWSKELSATEVETIFNKGNTFDLRNLTNLEAYWRMGEGDSGTTIIDWSNNGYNAEMINMSVASNVVIATNYTPSYPYTPLVGAKSLDFDGSDDILESSTSIPISQWFDFPEPFTVSFWAKSSAGSGANGNYFSTITSGNEGLEIQDGDATHIYVYFKESVSKYVIYTFDLDTNEHRDGNWHNFVFGWDGNYELVAGASLTTGVVFGLRFWLDGVPRPGSRTTYWDGNQELDGSGPIKWAGGYEGRITEGAVWNRLLDNSEMQQLYNLGIPTNVAIDFPYKLLHYWRFGSGVGDAYPTIVDQVGYYNLTMTNMDSGDIITDHPSNPT